MLSSVLLSETADRSRRAPSGTARSDRAAGGRRHVHWFRWAGNDAFSSASLYACRCGEVRSGF